MKKLNQWWWEYSLSKESNLLESINTWKNLAIRYPDSERAASILKCREQELEDLYIECPLLKRTKI